MLNVKSIAEVNQIIHQRFADLRMPAEKVKLEEALGRVLAEDALASEFVPDFNRSTVDGYALRASDVFGCSESIPAILAQIGEVHMGAHSSLKVGPDQCVYVPTGGEVPEGADTMVMLEYADDLGGHEIAIYKPSPPGANMIFRGDDVKPGQVVLPSGRRLNVADIGALGALGKSEVSVRRKPRVAIISTGDELVAHGETLTPGKIRDVNAVMLASAVLEEGGHPHVLGIIKDNEQAVRSALLSALKEHDLVLLSGGTSVGEKDAVPKIVADLGELLVHGVAAKPGKPTLFGSVNYKPVYGLPGNPVAAYFMFYSLVRPLLAHMLGAELISRSANYPLARAVPSNHGREEFVPVIIKDGLAHPIASKSGLITTLSGTSGFIRIPRDLEGLSKGQVVEVTLFAR